MVKAANLVYAGEMGRFSRRVAAEETFGEGGQLPSRWAALIK